MRRSGIWLAGLVIVPLLTVLSLKVPAVAEVLDGPDFCGMCHVMQPQVDSYLHSGHRETARCGECHVPHSVVEGAFYKAYTGTRDMLAVTTGVYPMPVTISEHGREVVQENCLRCHEDMTARIGDTARDGGLRCFDCHRSIAHLK